MVTLLLFTLILFYFIFFMSGFNDTSTLVGHFVSSPRENEKRDSRRDEKEGQGRKKNRNESEETEDFSHFVDVQITVDYSDMFFFCMGALEVLKGRVLCPRKGTGKTDANFILFVYIFFMQFDS